MQASFPHSQLVTLINGGDHQHRDRIRQRLRHRRGNIGHAGAGNDEASYVQRFVYEQQVVFIENMIEQKKKMQDKIEELMKSSKNTDDEIERNKKVFEDRLNVELKKNREAWNAQEKIRREKWEQQKEHDIRANTVYAMEPEI